MQLPLLHLLLRNPSECGRLMWMIPWAAHKTNTIWEILSGPPAVQTEYAIVSNNELPLPLPLVGVPNALVAG